MSSHLLRRNAIAAGIQVTVSALILFLAYRIIAKRFGLTEFGSWVMVTAVIGFFKFSDFGISGIAAAAISKSKEETRHLVLTRLVLSAVFLIFSSFLAIFLALILSQRFGWMRADSAGRELAIFLKYWGFWLTGALFSALTLVFQSVMDGLFMVVSKSIVIILGQSTFLLLVVILPPGLGIEALVHSFFWQQAVTFLGLFCVLLFGRKFIFHRESFKIFEELRKVWRKGIASQAVNVLSLTYDPLTKFLLIQWSGPEFVALFELAQRMVLQTRTVFVSVQQVALPKMSRMLDGELSELRRFFQGEARKIFSRSSLIFVLLMMASPVASFFLLSRVDSMLITYMGILVVGNWFNLLSLPAYLFLQAELRMRPIVLSHFVIALGNFGFSYLFAVLFTKNLAPVLGLGLSLGASGLALKSWFSQNYKNVVGR